ncbi:basic proline-rich protein-like [Mustela putorius furo]|uniref:Basic proline-rich protein-like n=1 Tax=Mustela putorius furo TaxID=9669 RepID=M3Y849_MUSPF|nr:basic proline-rich protein-like [Mustela putorius furo]
MMRGWEMEGVGRGSCARLLSEPEAGVRFLGNGSPVRVRPSPRGRPLSPPPPGSAESGAEDPRQRAQVWPGGAAGVGGGDPGRLQLPTAVSTTPAGLRGRAGTGRARGGTTSLFPPGLRPLGLKRVFPVGLPNPGWRAQPPRTRPEWRVTPPRPRARPGREVEPLVAERESSDAGQRTSGPFHLHPPPPNHRMPILRLGNWP